MAKMFYTASEAAERLGKTEDQLKDLVRAGKLREFRDAGMASYKAEDIDAIAGPVTAAVADIDAASAGGGSGSGEILLEPVEDSGIELAPSGSDVVSLDESDASASASGTTAAKKEKKEEGTVVPSVGVNVFDDDELDEQVDPLAQTAVTDVAGLGMEGAGSGSGILDLTRESDDTSLGRELLDEIYTGDGEKAGTGEVAIATEGEATVEMGDDTRAGLEQVAPEAATIEEEEPVEVEAATEAESATAPQTQTVVREVVEYGPNALSTSLTALLIVAVAVMWFAFLGAAALVRGITPALLQGIYANLWMYAVGALGVGAIAAGVTYFVVKKRSG